MKTIVTVLATMLLISGCASSSSQYYEAIQKAAEANSAATQAKFEALSQIASSGDGQAASAAVMALALTQTPAIQPIPQQSEALQWASVLASPVTSLGMMWMQSDTTKQMAKYNSEVDLARITADSTTQQTLYGSFVSASQITGDVATAGMTAMGNVDYSPFVDGMVSLGTAGIDGAVDLGTAGFNSNVAISTVGLNTAGELGVTGMDNLTNLGAAGMLNLTTLGQSGMTNILNMGTAGLDGMQAVSLEGFDTLMAMDADNNDLYGTVWTQYQQSIQSILNTIPNCTATIAADGAQTVVCN